VEAFEDFLVLNCFCNECSRKEPYNMSTGAWNISKEPSVVFFKSTADSIDSALSIESAAPSNDAMWSKDAISCRRGSSFHQKIPTFSPYVSIVPIFLLHRKSPILSTWMPRGEWLEAWGLRIIGVVLFHIATGLCWEIVL